MLEGKRLHILVLCLFFALVSITGSKGLYPGHNSSGLYTKNSVAGDYLSAKFAEKNRNTAEAIKYFSSAIAKESGNASLINKGFELTLKAGKNARALQLAEKYVNIKHQPSNAHILLALDEVKKKNFARAEEILAPFYGTQADEISVTADVIMPLLLSWVYVGQAEYDKATGLLTELEGTTATPFLLYQQALIYDISGQNEKAEEAFDALLQSSEHSIRLVEASSGFYNRIGKADKARKIVADYNAGNEEFYGENILLDEKNKRLVASAADGITEVFLEIGSFLYANAQYDLAAIYARMALFLSPDISHLHILMANIYKKQGHLPEAIAFYRKVKEPEQFVWQARMNVARLQSKLGNFAQAKQALLTMAEEKREDYNSLLTLADLLLDKKEYVEAAELYSKAIARMKEIKESQWIVFYARGICYERSDNWQRAEKDFLKALELQPNQPDALNYLAYSWLIMGKNVTEAKKMLETAISLRPDDAHIIDSYGWALYKLGNFKEAVEHLERANLMIPYDPTTNDHLGDIYWHVGRFNEARFQWERALTFNPEPDDVEKIKQKIKHGLVDEKPAVAVSSAKDVGIY